MIKTSLAVEEQTYKNPAWSVLASNWTCIQTESGETGWIFWGAEVDTADGGAVKRLDAFER